MLYEYHLLLSQPLFGKKMSFEDRMKVACNGNEIPGVVLAADGPGPLHVPFISTPEVHGD
jgi:hypothetical protein